MNVSGDGEREWLKQGLRVEGDVALRIRAEAVVVASITQWTVTSYATVYDRSSRTFDREAESPMHRKRADPRSSEDPVMGLVREARSPRLELSQPQPEELDFQQKAAAFGLWHEPDDSRGGV